MSLHADLLEQAIHLAQREPRRPRQASLRRSVSAAYYALFHLLVDESTGNLIGTSKSPLRDLTARAFNHNEMKSICVSFSNGYGSLAKHLRPLIPSKNISSELKTVANTFVILQEARHDADYERASKLRRTSVLALLQDTEEAFNAWDRIRREEEAKVFLVALLLDKQWRR